MSVAATRRLDVMLTVTSAARGTRSCAQSRRAIDGLGAMSMKFTAVSRKKDLLNRGNLWLLKSMM